MPYKNVKITPVSEYRITTVEPNTAKQAASMGAVQ